MVFRGRVKATGSPSGSVGARHAPQTEGSGGTVIQTYGYDALNRRVTENAGTAKDLYYSANWQVLELNRAIPQIWRGSSVDRSVLETAFGVRMLQPSDLYTQNYRAVRYGILFVAITFACFFAWEHLVRGMRLHPMQYLLVGLALATFYLLLLALSEHIGFAVSYALAAGALVALITAYISGATNNRPAAAG